MQLFFIKVIVSLPQDPKTSRWKKLQSSMSLAGEESGRTNKEGRRGNFSIEGNTNYCNYCICSTFQQCLMLCILSRGKINNLKCEKLIKLLISDQFSYSSMSSPTSSPLDLMPSSSSIVECYCGHNSCSQCNLLLKMEGEWQEGVCLGDFVKKAILLDILL